MSRILVLYWYPKGFEMRLAVERHLHALDGHGHEIVYHNAIDPARWLRLSAPDLVVLHPTFLGVRWNHDFESYRQRFAWLANLDVPKLALPQDEYDHSAVLEDWLLELRVDSVYSCFGEAERSLLYPRLQGRVAFRETLTGYIDDRSARALAERSVPHSERPSDIVYRAARLPYWFGSHGQLKHRIAAVVEERASALGFSTDISTRQEDSVFGERWLDFVMSGRATIGCESGSSVIDRRGELQARIRDLLDRHPELTFEEIDVLMPSGWDAHAFYAISPRHLEAVIAKTAQILVEGAYSGVLEPYRHYIPLRRDFSNLDEALAQLRDHEMLEEMTARAYDEVYLSRRWVIERFADDLCDSLRGSEGARGRGRAGTRLAPAARRTEEVLERVASRAVHLGRSSYPYRVAMHLLSQSRSPRRQGEAPR